MNGDQITNSIVGGVPEPENQEEKLSVIRNSFSGGMGNMKKTGIVVLGIIVAGLLVLLGFSLFGGEGGDGIIRSPLGSAGGSLTKEDKVVNPLNGELFKPKEAEDWLGRRPLAVMVNNHIDARPQSGLIYADLVYEIVAEGGITRLLPFFKSETPEKIGPVRSTREYYLVFVKEMGDAMLMHIGWSPQALAAIESWPVRSLGRGGGQFWRDNPRGVAIEHTAYVNGKDLVELGVDTLGWGGTREYTVWQYKDEVGVYDSYPNANDLFIDFWFKGDYSAIFKYDTENNSYLRSMGYDENDNPIPHADQDTKEQINVKNVIVQYVTESPIPNDPKGRLDYELVGSGTGLVFIDGKVIDVSWNKEARDERTMFYDSDGAEIQFNRGQIWVSVVPDRNIEQVVYN